MFGQQHQKHHAGSSPKDERACQEGNIGEAFVLRSSWTKTPAPQKSKTSFLFFTDGNACEIVGLDQGSTSRLEGFSIGMLCKFQANIPASVFSCCVCKDFT